MFDTTRPEDKSLTPADDELLRKRAQAYAKPLFLDHEETREAVVFVRGAGRYACPLNALRELRPLRKLCLLPLASRIVPGAVHVRGELLSVHDLAAFLEEQGPVQAGSFLLVVELEGERIALLADDVLGVEAYRPSCLHPLPLTLGDRASCFQGMLADKTMLLQPPALFTSPEFSSAY